MSLLEISLLTAACVNVCIGFYALYVRPRYITTYALFLFSVGLGIWVGSFFLLLVTHNFLFDKLNHYAGLLFIGGLFLLSLTFPDKKFHPVYLIAFLPFLAGIVFAAHGGVVLSDTFGPGDTVTPHQGPLFPFYAIGLITYLLVSILLFLLTYRRLQGSERLRMKYLFLGIALFVIPVCIFDIGLPAIGFSYLNLIGPLASVGFVISTFYAVIRHQLMDIRVVIQRGTIYSVLISLTLATYIGVLLAINNLFDANMGIAAPISASIVILIAIVTVPRIERYFRKATDSLFFKDRYDYALSLEELSEILNGDIQLARLALRLLQSLNTIFKPTELEFIHMATGTTFTAAGLVTTTETPRPVSKNGTCIAVVTRERTIGIFTLGPKRSGDSYTTEDRRLLRTFASHAATAFEKTELYEQLDAYSKSLEEKVNERTKSLAELQQHQRELFDDISHALQTPLTVLKSAMELLKVRQESEEARPIESMVHSVDDLSGLVRDLLELARIDAMPAEERSASIDISSLASNVIEYVEIICQQQRIRIKTPIEPDILMTGNEKQLSEMITNLLSNAVRYTGSCLVREITISVQPVAEQVEIVISDTGIGISEDQLPHIFDRFYRARNRNSDATGYGLGLTIVKRIVDRHGGTIRAESELGKGTSFILLFPQRSAALQGDDVPGATIQS
jgi:signal transduction histidine kinase